MPKAVNETLAVGPIKKPFTIIEFGSQKAAFDAAWKIAEREGIFCDTDVLVDPQTNEVILYVDESSAPIG